METGKQRNNIHLTLISLTSPSDSDTMMGVFERNRFVKESLKVTPECKMGEKRVYPSPVGWDKDEQILLGGR